MHPEDLVLASVKAQKLDLLLEAFTLNEAAQMLHAINKILKLDQTLVKSLFLSKFNAK
jgi:peptidoglycan hydrolase CwlO-like protein